MITLHTAGRRPNPSVFPSTVGVILALVAGACGQGPTDTGDGGSTSTSEMTTSIPATAAPPTPALPTTAGRTALQRKDAPPQGVKEQFGFVGIGDPPCGGSHPRVSKPSVVVVDELFTMTPTLTLGRQYPLCFVGFQPDQPVDVAITLPDGRTKRVRTDVAARRAGPTSDLAYIVFWYGLPGDPVGTYKVAAAQGQLQASGAFAEESPSTPSLLVAQERTGHAAVPRANQVQGPPGTVFWVGLAGLPRNTSVSVYVYRQQTMSGTPGTFAFTSTMSVTVDDHGQTVHQLATVVGDPPGHYCLTLEGDGCSADGHFTVTS